jgi:hypothetical protein
MKSILVLVATLLSFSAFADSQTELRFIEKTCSRTDCSMPEWVRNPHNLSRAERIALHQYTLGEYGNINPALSRGNLNRDQQTFLDILDAGLRKIPNQKATVYRGTSQRHDNIREGDEGRVITLAPYTSTSLEREDAEGFIRDRLMILNIKSGKNIISYANAPNEDELLLPHGTQIRIDKVEMKTLNIFTEEGPEDRLVQVVHGTEI